VNEAKHLGSKQKSQLDRLLNFSDGVFAIAITLLIIEIAVPTISKFTDEELWKHLSAMLLKFLGFLISFAVVGYYQVVHHRIFGYVQRSNAKLLWVNLAFLLTVVFLPFSSGLLSQYGSELQMKIPYGVYVLNMVMTALMNAYLWKTVSSPKQNLLTHNISKARIRLGMYRTAVMPVVFLVSFLVSFIFPFWARFIPLLIPFILGYGMKGLERTADLNETVLREDNNDEEEE
jgi:uncharacterized membrane protein